MRTTLLLFGIVLFVGGVFAVLRYADNGQEASQENAQMPITAAPSGIPEGSAVVTMGEEGYEPLRLTISQGDTVTFTNAASSDRWPASNIHPTHEIYSEFDPKRPVSPGESWSFTFDRAGEWRFHDHLYPQFTGVIQAE